MYGLLPDTCQATYISFLQILKQADATINPGTVSTDYEKAATNELHAVFLTPVYKVVCTIYLIVHTTELRHKD